MTGTATSGSAGRVRLCPLRDIPPGEGVRFDEVSPPIAVFHTEDGEVFAIDDTCTHQDASLADGWLEGCEIECWLHGSRFDLRTGEPSGPPAIVPIAVHTVRIEGDDVLVALTTES